MKTLGRQVAWNVSCKVAVLITAWLGYEALVLTGGHVLVVR